MKVFVKADVTPSLIRQFLQHIRDFDIAHPGNHFEICMEGPDITMAEMVAQMRIDPELTFAAFFERPKNLYRNDAFPERACDYCGTMYRGPAVYCSFECASHDR
jgi:hypothetical protein